MLSYRYMFMLAMFAMSMPPMSVPPFASTPLSSIWKWTASGSESTFSQAP
jgi:hypothetical protein